MTLPSRPFVVPDPGGSPAGVDPGTAPSAGSPAEGAGGRRVPPRRMTLRPMSTGEILDGAFTMIRRNPRVMLGLSALIAAVQTVVVGVLQVFSLSQLGRIKVTSAADALGRTSAGPALGNQASQLIALAVGVTLGAVLTGMLTIAIAQEVIGVRLGPAQVWRAVRPRLWRLIVVAVLASVAQVVGLILLIAPGVWLWGIWALVTPALVVEGTTVRGAFGRSRRLVRRDFWHVWGTRALGFLVAVVLAAFVTVPLTLLGQVIDSGFFHDTATTSGNVPIGFLLLSALGTVIATTFTAPIRSGVDAFLYLDQRMRREGLDIVMSLAAPGPSPASSAPPAPGTGTA